MNCRAARQAVHRRLDGELRSAAADTLTQHLAACPACAAVAAGLEAVCHRLRQLDQLTPLPAYRPTIIMPTRWRRLVPLGVAAALAITTVGYWLHAAPHPATHAAPTSSAHTAYAPPSPSRATIALRGRTATEYLTAELPTRNERVHIVWLYPRLTTPATAEATPATSNQDTDL